ncbi:MAG: transposase [Chloroflexi bacterium]|nr:transposase [Chloroflexota bacterium]
MTTERRKYTEEFKREAVQVLDADHEEPIELPSGAVTLLLDILGAMASGQGVTRTGSESAAGLRF